MLVLLSSGSRARYREDIIRALALPRGADLQFRYERNLLQDVVASRIDRGGYWFEPALIAYLWNQRPGERTVVVPCRLALVSAARFVGSTCIFSLVVQGFAELDDQSFRRRLTPAEAALVPSWETSGSGLQLQGQFVFTTATDFEACSSSRIEVFERTVAALRDHPDFLQVGGDVFYSVRDVRPIVREPRHGIAISTMSQGKYELKVGQAYDLEVYCFSPPGDVVAEHAHRQLCVETDSPVEFPLGKKRDVDSEYDVKSFRLFVPSRPTGVETALRLFVTGPGDDSTERADILLPVAFSGSHLLATVQIALIAAASAGPAMIGVWAAGKPLELAQATAMVVVALLAATGIVYTSLKRP